MTVSYAQLKAWDHTYLWHPFTQMQDWLAEDPVIIARGEGNYLIDVQGNKYLDGVSAFLAPYEEFKTFFHGHTYTGNPLACAAALASLTVFEHEQVLDKLEVKIALLTERLRTDFAPLAHVADIRQWGMMVGIELMHDPERKVPYAAVEKIGMRVITEARKRGVIIRPLGNVIVLMPPLSLSTEELTFLLDVVRASIITVTEDACAAS